MGRRDRRAPGSQTGWQAWTVSALFHAVLLTLCLPLVQPFPQLSPDPFRWTISLVEPFEPPSEGRSTPPTGSSHESESGSPRVTTGPAQAPLAETARGAPHAPALPPSEPSRVGNASGSSQASRGNSPPALGNEPAGSSCPLGARSGAPAANWLACRTGPAHRPADSPCRTRQASGDRRRATDPAGPRGDATPHPTCSRATHPDGSCRIADSI